MQACVNYLHYFYYRYFQRIVYSSPDNNYLPTERLQVVGLAEARLVVQSLELFE